MMVFKVVGSGSKGNGYIIEGENEALLIEAGCKAIDVKKALGFQISKVAGMLISHQHGDHCKYISQYMDLGFPIYTNDETQKFIKDIYGEVVAGVRELKPIIIGRFSITPFYVPHNGIANFGYLIKHEEMGKLLFLTDLELCPYSFKGKGINHLVIENNYDTELIDPSLPNYKHKILGHCSTQTMLGIVEENKSDALQSVILCHLGEGSDPYDAVKQVKEKVSSSCLVELATKGKEIKLEKDWKEE